MKKRLAILGASGSVGTSALDVLTSMRDGPDRDGDEAHGSGFELVLLSAHRSAAALAAAAARHGCPRVALSGFADRAEIGGTIPGDVDVHFGADGLIEALDACGADAVLNAITGAAGLRASAWALEHGKELLLANKESLVVAGPLLVALRARSGATILPVDSEHAAIDQCLRGERRADLKKIYLTASGGPFRERPKEDFATIRVEDALRHPTWDMGPRITIGSATMMNKTFEVLEAHHLFALKASEIDVVVHRQSIVHSMVAFRDGSMMAQLGVPDMRVPIAYCLGHPHRIAFEFEPFDPLAFSELNFEAPDFERFPALRLGFRCIELGGDSGAVLNAADEIATQAFLEREIPFSRITEIVEEVLEGHEVRPLASLDQVLAADRAARDAARNLVLESIA